MWVFLIHSASQTTGSGSPLLYCSLASLHRPKKKRACGESPSERAMSARAEKLFRPAAKNHRQFSLPALALKGPAPDRPPALRTAVAKNASKKKRVFI